MYRRSAPAFGVAGLSTYIQDYAPAAVRHKPVEHYRGKKIAIDASLAIFQFAKSFARHGVDRFSLQEEVGNKYITARMFQNRADKKSKTEVPNVNQHLAGMLTRVTWMLAQGVTPVFVFDGKRPDMKLDLVDKRQTRRDDVRKELDAYLSQPGRKDPKWIANLESQLFRLTKEEWQDIQTLLKLCGIPVIEAPYEAEAQCAELASGGLVHGVATRDMDTLAFGAPIVIKNFAAAEFITTIKEFHLAPALKQLKMKNRGNFVDLCLMLGTDYCPKIQGMGLKGANTISSHFPSLDKYLVSKAHTQLDLDYRLKQLSGKQHELASKEVLKKVPFYMAKKARDWKPTGAFKETTSPQVKAAIKSIKALKGTSGSLPESYPFAEARDLFMKHPVIKSTDLKKKAKPGTLLKQQEPDYKATLAFLESRNCRMAEGTGGLEGAMKKLRAAYKKHQTKK